MAKTTDPPPPPNSVADGVPDDLDDLCLRLLSTRPSDRPPGAELRRALSGATPAPIVDDDDDSFVGRERHLQALAEALDAARHGRATAVLLRGESGMGKSTLVRRFLDSEATRANAVVLEGRCYQRESVPFKALDSLIDALSAYLRKQPQDEIAALLPRHAQALARVFPVLRRVEAIAGARRGDDEAPSALELRRRAVVALRELLSRVAATRPFVLYIDDLQWGDVDSASVLFELLRPPDPPAVLLIAAYRAEDVEHSELLRVLQRRFATLGAAVRDVVVGSLTTAESEQLARALLGPEGDHPADTARTIAWEAGGNPLFVRELARHARSGATLGESIALDDVIRGRCEQLPAGARRLLEIVAVAAAPVPLALAERAADVSDGGTSAAQLRSRLLVRSRGSRHTDPIECYHDRIRETVAASIDPDVRRAHHRRLAVVLETTGAADAETLAVHWRDAGEHEPAAGYALAAAADAAAALAFDRAATLYRIALKLRPDTERRHEIEVARADSLANAGRGADAADVYLGAVERAANRAEAIELQRRAAEQLLRTGHLDRGFEVVERVLRAVGLRWTRSPKASLLSLLWLRVRIRLRGQSFRERDASDLSVDDLLAVDTCWSIASGLALVDFIRATAYQSRHLLLALDLGEPYRLSRALSAEAPFIASEGVRQESKALAVCERAEQLAKRSGDPRGIGFARLGRTLTAFACGRWREVVEHAKPAIAVFRNRCSGAQWEITTTRHALLWSFVYLGQVAELPHRIPAALREAEDHGDRYTATMLRSGMLNLMWLVDDDVTTARAQLDSAEQGWTRSGFHVQHYDAMLASANLNLYSGAAAAAHQLVCEGWGWLAHSMLDRIEQIRIEALALRARAHLAVGAIDDASRSLRALSREVAPWARPLAALVSAAVVYARGNEDNAVDALGVAQRTAVEADMLLHAAAAQRRRGALLGGDEGASLIATADGAFRAQGIARPDRWTRMLAPGLD